MRAPDEFHTERLRLRPVRRTDAEEIFRTYASEAAPTRFMPFERHRDIAESVAFAERCEESRKSGAAFPWAVTDKTSGTLMGVLELRLAPPKADFGYIFGEPFWGRGFAGEAASAVVAWAIAQPEIFRVWATCHPGNAASAAVLRKAGLSYEATLANWESRPQLDEIAGSSDCYALTRPPR
ncbi:GNAT family N-acetyltransferase [Caulobacter soli]|uniref:GNAT family N-acetyltransferase n=1 Tax=Caulobacter soli TaxID=2708539 RepID=UPI0013ECE99B|nr:GNAT family N-acetyltransferase [Caulobacter soli]